MQLRINDWLEDSIVDGPGLRLAIFCQGCPHHCPGCHNPATHDPQGGRLIEVEQLTALVKRNPLSAGITLSGGEPFVQAAACAALAREIHQLGKTVWTYSGYTYEELLRRQDAADLLAASDVLVDGPFILSRRSLELQFRGSDNQRIIDLTKSRAAGTLVLWQDPWQEDFPPALR